MYKLPNSFNPSIFLGKTLDQICFTLNTVSFHFGQDISLTVMGSFLHMPSTSSGLAEVQTVPIKESNLMEIIGATVQTVHVIQNDGLELHFNNGSTIQIFNDSSDYECYSITINDKTIIV